MAIESAALARVRSIDLRVIDRVLALLLTVGALVDAGALSGRSLGALSIVSCVALTGSVAWRRQSPVVVTLVAASGLVVFELASGYARDGAFEAAAIASSLYLLGRRARGQRVLVSAAAFAYWLAASVAAGYSVRSGRADNALFWALCGGLPFVVGRTLAARSAATDELETTAARLEDEQTVRARRAAAEERNRMARELHDVIAHCVSVMVVQTGGARRAARWDLDAACDALRVVEGAGREALVELRRIVGVLHRRDDELGAAAAPGLSQLNALADRARAAGLPVELCVEGRRGSLSPGLDLVVYRIVQEALTNAIKHAGPASARVRLTLGASELEISVSDSGRGPASGPGNGSGHGLVGMSERVRLYGGELHAGARASEGFEVRARIPLDGCAPRPQDLLTSPPKDRGVRVAAGDPRTGRWLDPLLASVFLIAFELEAVASGEHGGKLLVDMLVIGAMALACIWRRQWPLWFLIAVVALVFPLSGGPLAPSSSLLAAIYVGLIPPYAVAAWEERRNAVLGLVIIVCGSAVGEILLRHVTVGNYVGALFTICAAWAAGRAIRARRVLGATLERTTARLAAEREDRAHLAIAGERSRIARELHAVVAHSVAAMVIQAEAARGLLGGDPASADTALEGVESTGRQALGEMRRILGVLRHRDDAGELEPQPGVDQIYRLIQHARKQGQRVELSVDGEPGTLSAGVDLGIYRILEEALSSVRQQPATALGVALHFGEKDLELQLTTSQRPSSWLTAAMRERVALCGGELNADQYDTDGWQLTARMPRGLQGVLAAG